ncbi:MAG: glycosyltransferase family 2 protein [Pseudomonadota bacterium]|nr:glycosyltransferase family 2 protein [Pseudomonadota bacterium]
MADAILAVIPCLNEEQHLEKLVRDLEAATRSLPIRICIVDGGSQDRTPEIAKKLTQEYPNVLFLHNPKRIQGAAINLAVEAHGQDAEFLIRIDAHADYPHDYCKVLVDEAIATDAASVVVSMHTSGEDWFQKAVAAAQNSKIGNGGSAHRNAGNEGRWVDHGHHALMRIKPFREVGSYDESFTHNEDAELDMRLGKAGYKIWLTGKTKLTYYPRSTPRSLFRQYFQYGHGRARNIIKHRSLPKLRQLAPGAVLPAAVFGLLSPFMGIAAWPLEAWCALCLGYGLKLGFDAKDKRIAAAGPAAMIMHFGWSLGFWKAFLEEGRRRI